MKKLMIALSAVASAFAVHAAATTIAGENFNEKTLETLTGWSGLGDSSISSTAYTQHDANPAAGIPEQDKLALTLPGENLAIKTPLTAPACLGFTETSMAGVYFDSLVKFTACDEDATVVTDAKIMVWTKEMTNASGDVTGTNLMVTAGFFGTADALEPKVYDCGSITAYGVLGDGNDWCRLTIKAKNTVATSATVPAFVVFVNGKPATIAGIGDALKIGLDDSLILGALTKVDKIWANNHQLFPSMVSMNDQISAIGFAGQGAVDDIEVYSGINPTLADGVTPFANDPVPVVATVNGDDCTSIEAVNAAIANAASAAVVLVDDVAGDIVFTSANTGACTIDLAGFTLNGGVKGVTMVGEEPDMFPGTLTISDSKGTGVVMGTLTKGIGDAYVLNGGKYLASANESINDMAVAKEGFQITLNSDYYEITKITEDGTVEKPWKISSADDLFGAKAKLDLANQDAAHQNCVLMNNIDMASAGVVTGIGSDSNKPFMGVFDGQGYTISNLKFDAGVKGTALFMNAKWATIKNLTVDTVTYEGTWSTKTGGAMIVGNADGCQLIGLTAKGSNATLANPVTYNAAGIANAIDASTEDHPSLVDSCTNNATIYCGYTKAAGICPIVTASNAVVTIQNCYNNGTIVITDTANKCLGIAGIVAYAQVCTYSKIIIKDCVNEGVIDNKQEDRGAYTGGVFGYNYSSGNVEFQGVNTTTGDYRAMGLNVGAMTGADIELITGTVRQIPAGTLAAGNTYGILKTGVKPEIELAKTEAISINSNGYTWDATGITAAEGCKITTSTVGNVTTYTCAELVKATAPTAVEGLVYDGTEKTGVATGTGYTLTGNTAIDAGSYQATATLAEGYDRWSDDTTEAKTIDWSIAKATPTITTAPTASAEIEKGAALSTISLVGGEASTAGTFAWTTPETTVTESGEFDVTFTPTDAKNYTTATCKVTVTVKAGPQDWPENPEDVKGKTAGEAFGLEGELATADAVKVATWAKANSVKFGDRAEINVKAMLLNIANDGDVAAAEAAVKFTAEDLAALMANPAAATSLATKYPYATVTIGAYADAACTTEWTEGDQKFFKATLTVPQASVKAE